jgi:hypothetical protein
VVALHGGAGLQWMWRQFFAASKSRRGAAWALALFLALVLLAPPTMVSISDGPRSLLGRVWSPARWARWQASIDESTDRTRRLVSLLDGSGQNAVLSTHYNDEFFLRLRLMEAGFRPLPAAEKYPGCHGLSVLTKGDSSVVHIRTHPEYGMAPVSPRYNAALQVTSAFSCPSLASLRKIYVTTFGDLDWVLAPEVYSFSLDSFPGPVTIRFTDFLPMRDASVLKYGLISFRELKPQELSATLSKARQYLAADPEPGPDPKKRLSIEEYAQAYRALDGPTTRLLSALAPSD